MKTVYYAQPHILRRGQRLEIIGLGPSLAGRGSGPRDYLGPGMRFQNTQEAIMRTSIDSVTPQYNSIKL